MKILGTPLDGLIIIEPEIFNDPRGYFFESWNLARYAEAGMPSGFIQDNESKSSRGVVRGLHYQLPPFAQAKLIRVISGAVLDVALDIRRGSPTFGQHVVVELSGENKRQFFIPRGFAHGFAVISDETVFAYKCDNAYKPSHERGIDCRDPELAIKWPFAPSEMILSGRDSKHPKFADADIPMNGKDWGA